MINKIPAEIKKALKKLEQHNFEAYLVGGCVRDLIINRPPNDFDIATNAKPEMIIDIFKEYKAVPTGLKHGTVTILIGKYHIEITTFRCDGTYTDCRRPDSVTYSSSIYDDLGRRDFTMNSLALNLNNELIDIFNGVEHINRKIVVCTGNPEKRFSEDALRILRAIRFSSQLNFSIEKSTSDAVHILSANLKYVSSERIRDEFNKIICGPNCCDVLMKYYDVVEVFIPEIAESIGFEQHSPYHKYNVWEHTVIAVKSAPSDLFLRLTMFFHDIAKPACYKEDENGRGHFKGHAVLSSKMAESIMKRLHYDNKTIKQVTALIFYHSDKIKNRVQIKKMLSILGEELFFKLFEVKTADNSAKNDFVLKELEEFDFIRKQAVQILNSKECLTIKELKINGTYLKKFNLSGKMIGDTLNHLLDLVIEDKIENTQDSLLYEAEKFIKEKNNEKRTR